MERYYGQGASNSFLPTKRRLDSCLAVDTMSFHLAHASEAQTRRFGVCNVILYGVEVSKVILKLGKHECAY